MKASEIYRQAAINVFGNATGPSDPVVAAMDAIERLHANRDAIVQRENQEKNRHDAARLAIDNDWWQLQQACPHTAVENDMTCSVCRKEIP